MLAGYFRLHRGRNGQTRSLLLTFALMPFEEFAKQSLFQRGRLSGNIADLESGLEFVELGLLQQFLRRLKALPSRQFLAEVDFLPFRVSRRLLELGKTREKLFYEFRHATISIAIRLPIIRNHNSVDSDGLNRLTLINQIWIERLLQLPRGIDILKRSRVGDLQKVQIVVRGNAGKDASGLS